MAYFKDIFSPRLILLTLAIAGLATTLLSIMLLHESGSVAAAPFLVFGGA